MVTRSWRRNIYLSPKYHPEKISLGAYTFSIDFFSPSSLLTKGNFTFANRKLQQENFSFRSKDLDMFASGFGIEKHAKMRAQKTLRFSKIKAWKTLISGELDRTKAFCWTFDLLNDVIIWLCPSRTFDFAMN